MKIFIIHAFEITPLYCFITFNVMFLDLGVKMSIKA